MRRGAQGQTEKGSCLFEPQASLHETPAGPRTAGCPQRSGGTQAPGSPFFGLPYFGEAKKGESPAAATERHRNFAERMVARLAEEIGKQAFSGSEPKFAKPVACPAGAALCFAAKLRSDPKNQGIDNTALSPQPSIRPFTSATAPRKSCSIASSSIVSDPAW